MGRKERKTREDKAVRLLCLWEPSAHRIDHEGAARADRARGVSQQAEQAGVWTSDAKGWHRAGVRTGAGVRPVRTQFFSLKWD
jgi:hypothetical protein